MSELVMFEQTSTPLTPSGGKVAGFFDNTSISRFKYVDDAGGIVIVGPVPTSTSVTTVSASYASDTYLEGSGIVVNAGAWKAQTQYRCIFDMVKTAAGTAAFTVQIRLGTDGTTSDASVCSLAFAVGTAVADTGRFEIVATFRTVGPSTSAVVQGWISCDHHLASTGLTTTGGAGSGIINTTGAGFASTTQTHIGISVNGGTSFSGTNTQVQAELFGI